MDEGLADKSLILFIIIAIILWEPVDGTKIVDIDGSLEAIHDISTNNLGALCVTDKFRSLTIPLETSRFESARQKADLVATLLQDLGVARHNGLQDAIAKNLLVSDKNVLSARVLVMNATTGALIFCSWWQRQGLEIGGPKKLQCEEILDLGQRLDPMYPWYDDATNTPQLRSPKFMESLPNVSYKGWWTFPYYSCITRKWLISYSVPIPPPGRRGLKGFLSLDVDLSYLEVNQCESTSPSLSNEISIFHGTHKCHNATSQVYLREAIYRVFQLTVATFNKFAITFSFIHVIK